VQRAPKFPFDVPARQKSKVGAHESKFGHYRHDEDVAYACCAGLFVLRKSMQKKKEDATAKHHSSVAKTRLCWKKHKDGRVENDNEL